MRITDFLQSLQLISRAMSQARDVDDIVDDVLSVGLTLFKCDRIWLFYPCDPDAASFHVLAEKNRSEYPGAFAAGQELPISVEAAEAIRKAIASETPIVFDPESGNSLDDVAKQFSVQSQMIMAVQPRLGKPWMFGIHQCSHPRVWTKNEQMLFQEIGFWIVESLNNIVLLHDRGDQVIPVGESRRLLSALADHAGVHYTEMQFSHLDPVKGKLPLFRLVRELGKFFLAMYPLFRQAAR